MALRIHERNIHTVLHRSYVNLQSHQECFLLSILSPAVIVCRFFDDVILTSPITSWQIDGETVGNSDRLYVGGQIKLKDALWKKSYD